MKSVLTLLFSISFLFFTAEESGGKSWNLKKTKNGIKVYTRDIENSNLKELKIILTLESTNLSQIVSVLDDTRAYPSWVYKCKGAKKLAELKDQVSVDHYEMDFPWPLSDRDLITRSQYTQDRATKVLTIISLSEADYLPVKSPMVRMTTHMNKWVFTPLPGNKVRVEYLLSSHPGGFIPSWAVNMAIDYGPVKTMDALRGKLKEKKYRNAKIDWLLEY